MEGEPGYAAWVCFLLLLFVAASPRAADDHLYGIVVSAPYGKSGDFTADVRATLNYIACDSIVEDVLSAGARLEIRHTDGPTHVHLRPRERSAIIAFNPRLGTRVAHDRIQSPALALAHELGHVYRVLRGDHEARNSRFTPGEERAVIRTIEARVARCVGEPVRYRYSDTPVVVDSVTLGRSAPSAALPLHITLQEVRP